MVQSSCWGSSQMMSIGSIDMVLRWISNCHDRKKIPFVSMTREGTAKSQFNQAHAHLTIFFTSAILCIKNLFLKARPSIKSSSVTFWRIWGKMFSKDNWICGAWRLDSSWQESILSLSSHHSWVSHQKTTQNRFCTHPLHQSYGQWLPSQFPNVPGTLEPVYCKVTILKMILKLGK